MPKDYYGMGDAEAEAPPEPSEKMEGEEGDKPEASGETALLPISILGDKAPEVGKECKFKIVAVYPDEVEVEYVKHEEKPKDKSVGDKLREMAGEP